jgi:hypothetical protein
MGLRRVALYAKPRRDVILPSVIRVRGTQCRQLGFIFEGAQCGPQGSLHRVGLVFGERRSRIRVADFAA